MHHPNDSLKEVFATHQWVELSPDDWFAAAIVGAMRTGVNDLTRGSTRDRRPERNLRNDTSGVLAELLVMRLVERALPSQRLKYQLLDLPKAADLLDVQLAGSEAGLEAKSVLLLEEVRRRDFAINRIAADRSVRRGAMGYVGVLMAMGRPWEQERTGIQGGADGRGESLTPQDVWQVQRSSARDRSEGFRGKTCRAARR
jgi:hypothetical protein